MALDFPSSPTLNQTYTGPDGTVWLWDGAKWVPGVQSGAYAPLNSPSLTGDPRAPTPSPGDNDTSLATTAFVTAAVAPALNDIGRNLVHNSLFNVQQRGAVIWSANGYTADRWAFYFLSDTSNVSIQAANDAIRTAIDMAVQNMLQIGFTGNAAAGAYTMCTQPIENIRRLAGKTVTVSFWANATAALKLGVSIDLAMGSGGSPSATVTGVGQSVTLATNFARYSLTFTLGSTTGLTLGTNNDSHADLLFWFSTGATQATRAGNIGVQSGTVNIWGVQLEIGSTMTALEKPDPQQDLAKCQRFYQVIALSIRYYAQGAAAISGYGPTWQPMRAYPTSAVSGGSLGNVASVNPPQVLAFNSGRWEVTSIAAGDTYVVNTICTLTADF